MAGLPSLGEQRMRRKTPRWLVGWMVGCGLALLLALMVVGVGAYWLLNLYGEYDQVVGIRQELEGRFGAQDAFVPLPDGSVGAERVEIFLSIRDTLRGYCQRFQDTFGVFDRVEQMDQRDEDPSARELFGLLRSAMGTVPLLVEFFEARNRLLLEKGMGLGEYTYIYVLAYHSWLGYAASEWPDGPEQDGIFDRVHAALLKMLRAQRARIDEASPELEGMATALENEIVALEVDPARVPWQDGLPPAIVDSLAPHRSRLNESFCRAAASFELARNRRRAIGIQLD
jgi:hypothetical protein